MNDTFHTIKKDRKPGISFVVRCRNEERYISDCITSLQGLNVPHEIIVILHKCTDSSTTIVTKLKNEGYPIRIIEYNGELSRAGFETLITPADHSASLMSYYDFCFSHANYNWIMKWDADFSCSDELLEYFNNLDMATTEPTAYRIGCVLGDTLTINYENYLTNNLSHFGKHIFWEVPIYAKQYQTIELTEQLIFSISNKILKKYWQNTPWFSDKKTYDKVLNDKYEKAVEILGSEPTGLARAKSTESDKAYFVVVQNEAILGANDIQLYS